MANTIIRDIVEFTTPKGEKRVRISIGQVDLEVPSDVLFGDVLPWDETNTLLMNLRTFLRLLPATSITPAIKTAVLGKVFKVD